MKTMTNILCLGLLLGVTMSINAEARQIVSDVEGGRIEVVNVSNDIYTLQAIPKTGYEFLCWSDGSQTDTYSLDYSLGGMVSISASFRRKNDTFNPGVGFEVLSLDNASQKQFPIRAIGDNFLWWTTREGLNASRELVYNESQESECIIRPIFSTTKLSVIENLAYGGTLTYTSTTPQRTLTATANTSEGYEFLCWEDGTTTPSRSTSNTDASYAATFVRSTCTNGSLQIEKISGMDKFHVTAHPNAGYTFAGWSNGQRSMTIPYEEYMWNECQVTPIFPEMIGFPLPQNSYEGTIEVTDVGNGVYTLTAQGRNGYHFTSWYNSAESATRSVSFGNDAVYLAVFTPDYQGGHVAATMTDLASETYALHAEPDAGCSFAGWSNLSHEQDITAYKSTMGNTCVLTPIFPIVASAPSIKNEDGGKIQLTEAANGQTLFTAIPVDGYRFVCWEDGVATDVNVRTLTIVKNTEYAAIFLRNNFVNGHIELDNINNLASGNYTISAHPNDHITFGGWSIGEKNITIDYNQFDENTCVIRPIFPSVHKSVLNVPSYAGTISVNEQTGSTQLTATPNTSDGYEFIGWENNDDTNGRILQDEDIQYNYPYLAVFGKTTYPQGTLSIEVDNISAEPFTYKLTAQPENGVAFAGWSNGKTEKAISYNEEEENECIVRPTFPLAVVQPLVIQGDGGTLDLDDNHDGSYTLTATGRNDYHFANWEDATIATTTRAITPVINKVYAAAFTPDYQGGYVSVEFEDVDNDIYTLHAEPFIGLDFAGWSNLVTDQTIEHYSNAQESQCLVTPIFPKIDAAPIAQNEDGGILNISGEGDTKTFVATPKPGYRFECWEDGVIGQPSTREITVEQNKEYAAIFCRDNISNGRIELTNITNLPSGRYTLTATPNEGIDFAGWSNGEKSLQIAYYKEQEEEGVVRPIFPSINKSVLNIPSYAGTISVNEQTGSTQLTANPNTSDGYEFIGWENNDDTNGRILQDEDIQYNYPYLAVFGKTTYPQGTLSIEVDDISSEPFTYKLMAQPENGVAFAGWSNGKTEKAISYNEEEENECIVRPTFPLAVVQPLVIQGDGGTLDLADNHDGSYNLTATGRNDYHFANWEDATIASNTRAITPVINKVYAAAFTPNYQGGHVDVRFEDVDKNIYTLIAVEDEDATFAGWSTRTLSHTLTSYTEVKERSCIVCPIFPKNKTFVENEAGGIVTFTKEGDNHYTMTATPADGYRFYCWEDGSTSNASGRTVDATEQKEFAAVFGRDNLPNGTFDLAINNIILGEYQLTAHPNDNATFAGWSNGIDSKRITYRSENESTCVVRPIFPNRFTSTLMVPTYAGTLDVTSQIDGSQLLTATSNAEQGYQFICWEDNSTTNPRTLAGADLVNNAPYLAVFGKTDFTNGSIDIAVSNYADGPFEYKLTAHPEIGVAFAGWSNGKTDETITYNEEEESECIVRPSFPSTIVQQLIINGEGGYVETQDIGDGQYQLVATANEHFVQSNWENNSSEAIRTITPEMDHPYIVAFTPDLGKGHVQVAFNDPQGESLTLIAIPGEDSYFAGWSNLVQAPNLAYSEAMESQCALRPIFPQLNYEPEIENGTYGTVEATPQDDGYVLLATANDGYRFINWEDATKLLSRFVPSEPGTYIARFDIADDAVAKVGSQRYATLAEAIDAAEGIKEITLLTDLSTMDIDENKVAIINGNGMNTNTLNIQLGGDVRLTETLTANQVILNTTQGRSAQLRGVENLTYTDMMMDIQLEPTATQASGQKWYAISVPFEVDVESGVTRREGKTSHEPWKDFIFTKYDGNQRAATAAGWKYLEDPSLLPGQFYMMTIDGTQNVWRFKQKSGTSLLTDMTLSLNNYGVGAYAKEDCGWNALGNTQLFNTDITTDVEDLTYMQTFNNTTGDYEVNLISDAHAVVGTAFFVQTPEEGLLTFLESEQDVWHAPRRTLLAQDAIHEVTLHNVMETDRLFLTTGTLAIPEYETGKDVAKLSANSQHTHLWTNAYGYKLCAQDAPLENDMALFYLTMAAPTGGYYTLHTDATEDGSNLYLLQDGNIIWNLTKGDLELYLNKGENTEYDLLLCQPHSISTDGGNLLETGNGINKMVYDDHLYIIRDHQVYDPQGKRVYNSLEQLFKK